MIETIINESFSPNFIFLSLHKKNYILEKSILFISDSDFRGGVCIFLTLNVLSGFFALKLGYRCLTEGILNLTDLMPDDLKVELI